MQETILMLETVSLEIIIISIVTAKARSFNQWNFIKE